MAEIVISYCNYVEFWHQSLNLPHRSVHAAQRRFVNMRAKTKKLVATIGILIWLPFYALIAMRVGLAVLPDARSFATLVYYAVAGTAWILPVGLLLPWMHREP